MAINTKQKIADEKKYKMRLITFVEYAPFITVDNDELIYSATAHYRIDEDPKYSSTKVSIKYAQKNKALKTAKLPEVFLILKKRNSKK